MLSGIGDPDDAAGARHRRRGAAARRRRQSAGPHLGRHRLAAQRPGPLHAAMRLDRLAVELGKAYFFGTGIASETARRRHGLPEGPHADALPDMQLLFGAGADVCQGRTCRRSRSPMSTGSAAAPWCCARKAAAGWNWPRPTRGGRRASAELSRHRPRLGSAAGRVAAGARGRAAGAARRVRRRPRSRPGPERVSDADIDAHIRATGITVHHPLGTCRMGPTATRRRSSMRSCGFAGSSGCASSTRR